jgi:hypothetical protein
MLSFVMDVLFATVNEDGAQFPASRRSSRPRRALRIASVMVTTVFVCVVVWELLRWAA